MSEVAITYPRSGILEEVSERYEWINCEFIGDKLIEVHFRRNPDFRHHNDCLRPIWDDEEYEGEYVEDSDYKRRGFVVE